MDINFNSSLPRIRYRKEKTAFYQELARQVNGYFKENNISKYADSGMYFKTILLLVIWMGSYALMLSNYFNSWGLVFLQIVFHYSMFVMTIGIAHDGSHHAYSRKKSVNKLMSYVFDMVGINTYLWELNHIKSHHMAPNIPLYDSAIDSFIFFRFHPKAPLRWYHQYQHYYIFLIYCCSTLFKLFILDFFSFRRKRIGVKGFERHPGNELYYFLITRGIVICYTLVIPVMVIDAPLWQLLLGFSIGHFMSGLSLGIIFQTTHLTNRTKWPEPDSNGMLDQTFDQHILHTTADFAPGSKIVTWISGGLNHHVAHHLFPGICHTHLPVVTKMVQQASLKHGCNYHSYNSVISAVRSHLQALRSLGAMRGEPVLAADTKNTVNLYLIPVEP